MKSRIENHLLLILRVSIRLTCYGYKVKYTLDKYRVDLKITYNNTNTRNLEWCIQVFIRFFGSIEQINYTFALFLVTLVT